MNCAELFVAQAKENPNRIALWLAAENRAISFGELHLLAARTQQVLLRSGLKPGDTVLLVDGLNERFYAAVIAILGLGCQVMLVEPWLAVNRIDPIIRMLKPHAFFSAWFGKLWGLRLKSVRGIGHWIPSHAPLTLRTSATPELLVHAVEPNTPGIVAFTSGTSGAPKGVMRHQEYLMASQKILIRQLHLDKWEGPDLCALGSFALANLATGRTSLIIPPSWRASALKRLHDLPKGLKPVSLTCGPAFLLKLMKQGGILPLKSLHVGGALTDCWIFEEAAMRWPAAEIMHLYGSGEAQPVATIDARQAVKLSRERGHYQTLCLGYPIKEIKFTAEPEGLWVTGTHVCREYAGSAEDNKRYKRRDADGHVWHFMGDRIECVPGAVVGDRPLFWYGGRSFQNPHDFQLEQNIYSFLESSRSFVHRSDKGHLTLYGENLKERQDELRQKFPEIEKIVERKIVRDFRHRARIDRHKSIKRGKSWIVG